MCGMDPDAHKRPQIEEKQGRQTKSQFHKQVEGSSAKERRPERSDRSASTKKMDADQRYDDDGPQLPPKVEELAQASVPSSMKGLRACMCCGIVKTFEQFIEQGCENCAILELEGNSERCNQCTTAFFEGQVAVADPQESWTAKWLRVDRFLPGVYAISITGQFSKDVEGELDSRGMYWRCKPAGDQSK